jgi:serine O-acetyltransferase
MDHGVKHQMAGNDDARRDAPNMPEIPRWNIGTLVRELRVSRDTTHNIRHVRWSQPPPSREAIVETLNGLSAALFPSHYGQPNLVASMIDGYVQSTLETSLHALNEQVRRSLPFSEADSRGDNFLWRAREITRDFAGLLPEIRNMLVSDVRAAFDGDPAATGLAEILLVYPGMTAIIHHRLANALHELGARFIARIIADIAHSRTGIDIHPGARIGQSFFIDHGTGVVIGETTIIGNRVRLYQAVTLGARSFAKVADGTLVKAIPRHPIVEDDVVIYAGATVLGRITIGRGSTIGGNVWLTHGVPAGSQVTQAHTLSRDREGS